MKKPLFGWIIAIILSFSLAAHVGAAWLLRAENGQLIVRDLDGGDGVFETGVPLSALPEQDRTALLSGIVLHDHAALTKALEDFCS